MIEQRRFLHLIIPIGWRLAVVLAGGLLLMTVWDLPVIDVSRLSRAPHIPPRGGGDEVETEDPSVLAVKAYPAIAREPLFYPTRTRWTPPPPPPPPPPVVRPPPPLNRYTLTGVIVSGDSRTALVKAQSGNKTMILTEGEKLEGWTLQTISETHLLFTAGKATYEMHLPKPSEVRR